MRSKTLILGVDPGLTGALSFYDPAKDQIYAIYDMPTKKVKTDSDDNKLEVDFTNLATILDIFSSRISLSVIEKVHSMPGQGVSSTFKFGYSFGLVTGVIAAHHIPIQFTPPSVWKNHMGLSQNKTDSLDKVKRLQPDSIEYFKLKKHDGRAEATLLAIFGKHFLPAS